MGAQTGHDLKLYYNTGTHASPTWVEITQVEDVMVDEFRYDQAELKRRSTRFVLFLNTVLRAGFSFKLFHGVGITIYDDLRDAFLNRTPTEFYIADGAAATAGTEGLRIFCQLTDFPWDQPLTEVSAHQVKARPTYVEESGSEVLPDWYTISA